MHVTTKLYKTDDLASLSSDTSNSIRARGSRVPTIRILCQRTIVSHVGRLTFLLNCEIAVGFLLFRGYGLSEQFTVSLELLVGTR